MKKLTSILLIVGLALSVNITLVFAGNPDGSSGPWADYVVENNLGLRKDGSPVASTRSDPNNALGPADSPQPTINFYSLGFGGDITLGFENYICNDAGVDIKPDEVTWGSGYPEEDADVEVSQDGSTWFDVGTVNNQGTTTVDLPGTLYWVQYVKLTDTTDPGPLPSDADGYDLDAVEALHWSVDKQGCIPDVQGPITSNVIADPNPVAVNDPVMVTATVDDTNTGGSNVAYANYVIYDSDGVKVDSGSMADSFDSPIVNVNQNITSPSTAGIYKLCVNGTDEYGNIGPEECIMLVVYDPDGGFVTGGGWIDSPEGAVSPKENVVFFNGFESDIDGWFTPSRVMSGYDGIPSASGDYYAEAIAGDYTYWGGYNSVFPSGGFITSIDVYLDMNAGYANDTRFDWSSAISAPSGDHRRDFIFNGGFYNDDTGPGAGVDRFVFSASNNAPGWPKNPGRDPIAITTTGWYTLQHHFYDNGAGVLAVDLSILDANGNLVHTWTLSDPTDIIGDTVGGNRYGWFAYNYFPFLAIDNSVRKEFSNPTGKANFGFVSKYQKNASVPTGNTEFVFKTANLNFQSNVQDWLVVTGSNYAKFKGSGTINGELAPNDQPYKFQIWAGDGTGDNGGDTFRIKIWWEDSNAVEHVVYDNGMDQTIGGGSIVVHTK